MSWKDYVSLVYVFATLAMSACGAGGVGGGDGGSAGDENSVHEGSAGAEGGEGGGDAGEAGGEGGSGVGGESGIGGDAGGFGGDGGYGGEGNGGLGGVGGAGVGGGDVGGSGGDAGGSSGSGSGGTGPVCTSNSYRQCDDGSGDVYWFDSCDEKGEMAEDCGGGQVCRDLSGTVADCCDLEDAKQCDGGDVYWYGSCGYKGDLEEDCGGGQVCRDLSGSDADCCDLEEAKQCGASDNDVHWFDSCGVEGDVAEECGDREACVETSGVDAECQCANHWQGDGCSDCPGNWDPDQNCGACKAGWEGSDCESWCVRYVDVDAGDGGDGKSWGGAFDTIQEGIDSAQAALAVSTVCEVWVAEGVYLVYESGPDDTVQLASNVSVYGGFEGDEGALGGRDWEAFETIIDGRDSLDPVLANHVYHVVTGADDAALDGFTVREGAAVEDESEQNRDNYGAGMINSAASLTVANCSFKNNVANRYGGGMYNANNSIEIVDCSFDENEAYQGGGMYNTDSLVTITRGTFSGNLADNGGGGGVYNLGTNAQIADSLFENNVVEDYGHGGGVEDQDSTSIFLDSIFDSNMGDRGAAISISGNSGTSVGGCIFVNNDEGLDAGGTLNIDSTLSPHIENSVFASNYGIRGGGIRIQAAGDSLLISKCIFSDNRARYGGAIYSEIDSYTVHNSIFSGNDGEEGGAIWMVDGSPEIKNCVFAGNRADYGGALYNEDSSPEIVNCTFSGNIDASYAVMNAGVSEPTIVSSILWNESANEIQDGPSSTTSVLYSDVEGGWDGEGNTPLDPVFNSTVPAGGATWSSAVYDAETCQTEFIDDSASWSAQSLAGMFVRMDPFDEWHYIVDNTETSLWVYGDATDEVWVSGGSYDFYDLHLVAGSPCIDAAYGNLSLANDVEDKERKDDPDTEPNTGFGDIDYVDMGAYEYQPPPI